MHAGVHSQSPEGFLATKILVQFGDTITSSRDGKHFYSQGVILKPGVSQERIYQVQSDKDLKLMENLTRRHWQRHSLTPPKNEYY